MAIYRTLLLLVSCALSVGSQRGPFLPHHLRPGPGAGGLVPPPHPALQQRTWPQKPNTTGCRPSLLTTGRVSIKDHGARGDGVHDDAPALRAAMEETWRCGGSVTVPTGDYLINSTVQLAHCSIIGVGNEPVGYAGAAEVVAYDTGPAVRLFTLNPAGPVLQAGYLPGQVGYNASGGQNQTNYGAGVYLERLSIEGLETGMIIANVAWVRLRNCGVAAEALTNRSDNAALLICTPAPTRCERVCVIDSYRRRPQIIPFGCGSRTVAPFPSERGRA